MGRLLLEIDCRRARTVDEEYEYLYFCLSSVGNFFSWEVHPNKLKSCNLTISRIHKKIGALVTSEEFLENNPLYRLSE